MSARALHDHTSESTLTGSIDLAIMTKIVLFRGVRLNRRLDDQGVCIKWTLRLVLHVTSGATCVFMVSSPATNVGTYCQVFHVLVSNEISLNLFALRNAKEQEIRVPHYAHKLDGTSSCKILAPIARVEGHSQAKPPFKLNTQIS